MSRIILIDGYNIIKNTASFKLVEARNLAAARQALITQLLQRYRHTPYQVTVVFDGDGTHEQVLHERRIRIIYSHYGETADNVIGRLAAEAQANGHEVEMYSNDWEVQQAVAEHGGMAQNAAELTNQLNAPPSDVAQRSRHRIAMRRKYGLDTPYDPYSKDVDPPDSQQAKRDKKKPARRKR